jgi:UDP-glucose:(heptosyl)LPS alpha-1,3-glucosyltransferase
MGVTQIRVALVNDHFTLEGSISRLCVLLTRSLVKLGVDVHVYANPASRTVDVPGATFHDVPAALTYADGRLSQPLHLLSSIGRATRAVHRDRALYDLVHVSGCSAWEHDVVTVHSVTKAEQQRWRERGGRTYKAARARTFLAPVLWPRIGLLRWVQRLQLRPRSFARLIVPTDEVRDDLERLYGVPPARIEVIPYPITVEPSGGEDARDELRRSLGIPCECHILLFIGHAFERKGLLEAVEALPGLEPEAHLIVVGSGNETTFVRAVEQLGVAHRVHFVGGTTAPERFFAGSDLLLHPSREDVWGIAVPEAMAFGLPVVTTKVTGSAGEVRSAEAGVVLEDSSPLQMRQAISELLGDSERRREMGERGRVAAARFLPDAIAERTLDVYRDVLRERATRGDRL